MASPSLIKLWLLTVPAFFAADLPWLGVIARDFCRTNLATLPDWPLRVVLVDTAWRVAPSARKAVGSDLIGRWPGPQINPRIE